MTVDGIKSPNFQLRYFSNGSSFIRWENGERLRLHPNFNSHPFGHFAIFFGQESHRPPQVRRCPYASEQSEFVLIFLARYGPRAVFRAFCFRRFLSFLVCYIVRQQSQSILCGSVLTTMTTMTTMRLVQAQSWQSWQSKSRRTVRSATAKRKNNLGPQGGFVRNPWTPPPTGLAFTEDVISWCTL